MTFDESLFPIFDEIRNTISKAIGDNERYEENRKKELARSQAIQDFQRNNLETYKYLTGKVKSIPQGFNWEMDRMTYVETFEELRKGRSRQRRAELKVSDVEGTIERTYKGNVKELMDWLGEVITSIVISYSRYENDEKGRQTIKDLLDGIERHGGDVRGVVVNNNGGDYNEYSLNLTVNALDTCPDLDAFLDWKVMKFDYGKQEEVIRPAYDTKDNKISSRRIVLDYLLQRGDKQVTEELSLDETYSEEELEKLVGKTFNQQKIQNIYRRQKYNDRRLFAHTKCVKCGREKRVFLSNLVNDPEKYGSCVCSNTNVEARLDNINDLFDGSKTLSTNTSGYTGVTYIKTYKGRMYDKWRAYIEIDGHRTYLGDFDTKSAAVRARKKAAEKGLKWYREHRNEFMNSYRRGYKKTRRLRRKKN